MAALASYVSQGSAVAVATTAPAGYPSSFTAGDLLCLFIHSDSATMSVSTSGWSQVGSVQSGGGTNVGMWVKTATGSETGTITASITSGTKGVGYMVAYRKGGSDPIQVVLSQGASDTNNSSTAISATGSSWTVATNDLIIASTEALAASGTFGGNATSPSLTQAGATASASTSRFAGRTGTNTLYYNHSDAPVTSAGSGAPSYTATANGANASGSTFFAVIRDVPAAVSASSSGSGTATATVVPTQQVAATSSGTGTDTATVRPTVAVSAASSGSGTATASVGGKRLVTNVRTVASTATSLRLVTNVRTRATLAAATKRLVTNVRTVATVTATLTMTVEPFSQVTLPSSGFVLSDGPGVTWVEDGRIFIAPVLPFDPPADPAEAQLTFTKASQIVTVSVLPHTIWYHDGTHIVPLMLNT